MLKYIDDSFKTFSTNPEGYLVCPTGNYTNVKLVAEKCVFDSDCVFGDDVTFLKGCVFSYRCFFGEDVSFSDSTHFLQGCKFGKGAEFKGLCEFGPRCEFGVEYGANNKVINGVTNNG